VGSISLERARLRRLGGGISCASTFAIPQVGLTHRKPNGIACFSIRWKNHMTKSPEFDVAAVHKYFAAHCFNTAWELIEKPSRTTEEERLMVALKQASIFHWLNRAD